jgi:threonine dehydrogenase-like Zn-dependent dehydrogenase
MKAVCWQGINKVAVETVPDPKLINPRDAVVKVAASGICGSDLHLAAGQVPGLLKGDILGHEFMGEVVELGAAVHNLRLGDRVVVPCNIACGGCYFCERKLFALCDNSNPNGDGCAGMFGSTHASGGYAGGQAEYVRVPYADVGPVRVPDGVSDEKALLLSDVLPAGYMAAEACDIEPGQTVAIWGAGPVGQFAAASAFMLGAEQVFVIDHVPERLAMAERQGARAIDYEMQDVCDTLRAATAGEGPDAVIDAAGMEAHGAACSGTLKQAINGCRKGGTVAVPSLPAGVLDPLDLSTAFEKGLTLKLGQTHTHRYMRTLLERIAAGKFDPSFVISHRLALEDAPEGYRMLREKVDACTKVVMHIS